LDGPWTSYNPSLGRPLLNTEKFLAPKKTAASEEKSGAPAEEPPASKESADTGTVLPGVVSRQ